MVAARGVLPVPDRVHVRLVVQARTSAAAGHRLVPGVPARRRHLARQLRAACSSVYPRAGSSSTRSSSRSRRSALGLFVNSLAGFALSRLRWRGQKLVLTIIIATLIVPFETIAMPLLLVVNHASVDRSFSDGMLASRQGWLNSYQVQILPFVGERLLDLPVRPVLQVDPDRTSTRRHGSMGRRGSTSTAGSSCRCRGR